MFEFELVGGGKVLLPLFGCVFSEMNGVVMANIQGMTFQIKTTMQEIKYAIMQAQGAQAPQGKIQL